MAKGWTAERRAAQAARCRQNKPWEHSTGPKTKGGKLRASINAYKHGLRRYEMWSIDLMCLSHKAFLKAYVFLQDTELKEFEEKQRLILKHAKKLRTK